MVEYSFTLSRPPHIFFGPGRIKELADIVNNIIRPHLIASKRKQIGRLPLRAALLVTGAKSFKASGRFNELTACLEEKYIKCFHVSVEGEPSPKMIDDAVMKNRRVRMSAVIAIGGGSVLDAGKAISAMILQRGSVSDFLEGEGAKEHNGKKVPFIAVPTTAGTGSEATKNAVLSDVGRSGFKQSLRHDNFMPDAAVIDPELTLTCPKDISASCGMDAFTQLLESYTSNKATLLTDTLALSGLDQVIDNLVPVATVEGDNINVRSAMSYASLISGITLANAGIGVIHGFASSIGGFFNIPHGVICATLAASAAKVNINHLRKEKDKVFLNKYAKLGRMFSKGTCKGMHECCNFLVNRIDEWTGLLKIPVLMDYGILTSDVEKIIKNTSLKNNPARLTEKELEKIITARIK